MNYRVFIRSFDSNQISLRQCSLYEYVEVPKSCVASHGENASTMCNETYAEWVKVSRH